MKSQPFCLCTMITFQACTKVKEDIRCAASIEFKFNTLASVKCESPDRRSQLSLILAFAVVLDFIFATYACADFRF